MSLYNNDSKKVLFTVMQVQKFAERKSITAKDAFLYLKQYGAIDFLDGCYEVEHTLSDEIVFEDLEGVAQKNGGNL